MLDVIGRLKKKQEDRMKKMKVVTRRQGEIEVLQAQFIVAMDDYFSIPKVIVKLHETEWLGQADSNRIGLQRN